jgi:hypothetical protein
MCLVMTDLVYKTYTSMVAGMSVHSCKGSGPTLCGGMGSCGRVYVTSKNYALAFSCDF